MSGFRSVVDDTGFEVPERRQLALMVLDGSGSMTERYAEAPSESLEGYSDVRTKGAAVEGALKTLIKQIKSGHGPQNYDFAFVSFNDELSDVKSPQPLVDLSEHERYDPTLKGTGGTAIHLGLDAAGAITEQYLAAWASRELPVSVVVVLMSDGEEKDNPAKTRDVARRIRDLEKTTLAACLFATKDERATGQPLLEDLVTAPEWFQRVHNARELRDFFDRSITGTRPRLPRGS
jgi:von Willebrand factor type A domain